MHVDTNMHTYKREREQERMELGKGRQIDYCVRNLHVCVLEEKERKLDGKFLPAYPSFFFLLIVSIQQCFDLNKRIVQLFSQNSFAVPS